MNDEFAKEASSYETIEELKKDLRAKMEEEASRRAIDTYNADLIQTAVKNATVEIPEVMIEDRVEQMIQELGDGYQRWHRRARAEERKLKRSQLCLQRNQEL